MSSIDKTDYSNNDDWNESFVSNETIEANDNEDDQAGIKFFRQVYDGEDYSWDGLDNLVKNIRRRPTLDSRPVSLPSMKAEKEMQWTYTKITLPPPDESSHIKQQQQQQQPSTEKKEKFAWKLPIVKEPKKNPVEIQDEIEEEKEESSSQNDSFETQKLPRLLARGARATQALLQQDAQKSPVREPFSKEEKGEKPSFKNTKMCKHGTKCTRQGCNYAHTMKDFTPVPCKFDSCRKGVSCTFYHPKTETKEAFLKRISALN
jgi:hypothetical protein